MTDFFKNNPIALRNCIRFEILQGTSIKKAHSKICSAIGEELIDYNKFRIRFNHFSKKKFNDKEKPCAEILRNDKYALRVCILYESLKYQSDKLRIPIFEVFINFCKVIGVEDVLNYPEFEFWFYRFNNGEFDLSYEREMDKKIYELMDMPIDIMKNVVEYLDIFERINLAKTSRSLQTFVEDQKLFHHTLKLEITNYLATVSFRKPFNIDYWRTCVGCKRTFKSREAHFLGVVHWKQALLDFKGILKNSRLHLNTLEIRLHVNEKYVLNDLKDELKFTHYLNVKNLILEGCSWDILATILPILKPEYLTTINFNCLDSNPVSMNTVFEMEQRKQAKYFTMYIYACFSWPLYICIISKSLLFSWNNCHWRTLILFKSPNFETCLIWVLSDTGAKAAEEEFGDYIQQEQNIPEYVKIYHYPVPNSSEYFGIYVWELYIEITRKKR